MKKVILYIRVSTDEQADSGYSQRHQDELLTRYCDLNGHIIVARYFEDHSAKSFDRPQFSKLLLTLHKAKGSLANAVLFTKWDRFSRNAGDAYQMISRLQKLGVEALAAEQPLDMAIPESKIMLAFYLAAPEVENDRRAMNVSDGMMRARREGRFMGKAPLGYKNVLLPDGRKMIEPSVHAPAIVNAFNMLAQGRHTVEHVLKIMRSSGIKCSKNNFWTLIKNPLYAGLIPVPAYKGKPAEIVAGQHHGIITHALFYEVQDVVTGRKKSQREKLRLDDQFPLRGHLRCSRCGKTLTASSSVNKIGKKYAYYHCTSSCGERFAVQLANDAFVSQLTKLRVHPAIKVLLSAVLDQRQHESKKQVRKRTHEINQELQQSAALLEKALNKYLNDTLPSDDYFTIKTKCEQQSYKLEEELALMTTSTAALSSIIEPGFNVLERLPELYAQADANGKKSILCSMLSEKMEFSGNTFRTLPLNETLRLITSMDAAFKQKKMGQESENFDLSHVVNLPVLFSNTFLYQLRSIAALAA